MTGTKDHGPRQIRKKVEQFEANEGKRDMTSYHDRGAQAAVNPGQAAAETFSQRAGLDHAPTVVEQAANEPVPKDELFEHTKEMQRIQNKAEQAGSNRSSRHMGVRMQSEAIFQPRSHDY